MASTMTRLISSFSTIVSGFRLPGLSMLSAMEILSLSSPVYQMSWSDSIDVPLIFSIICWNSLRSIAMPDAISSSEAARPSFCSNSA